MTSTLPNRAKVMIGVAAGASLCVLMFGVRHVQVQDWPHFVLLLGAAALSSRFKVKLPGMTSSMSGNVPIILLAVIRLGLLGSLAVTAVAAVAQSYASGEKKTKPIQFLFNACTLLNAAGLAYLAYHSGIPAAGAAMHTLPLVLAAGTYFLANTVPVAGIIGLVEGGSALALWHKVFQWSFPNYVIGAGLTAIASTFSWLTVAAVMAVLFGVYQSYRMYVGHATQDHPKGMAAATGR